MSTTTDTRKSSNGFVIPDHFDLAGHDADDALVTIYIEERTPGRRGSKSAKRLHRVTCRHVTRGINAWGSSAHLLWDRDAARWAGEDVRFGDSLPMRMCTACGTDTLERGVAFWGETYADAFARRQRARIAEAEAQAVSRLREQREARERAAQRKAVDTVLAENADRIAALTEQYLAETEG